MFSLFPQSSLTSGTLDKVNYFVVFGLVYFLVCFYDSFSSAAGGTSFSRVSPAPSRRRADRDGGVSNPLRPPPPPPPRPLEDAREEVCQIMDHSEVAPETW